jgi:hypothetical protein
MERNDVVAVVAVAGVLVGDHLGLAPQVLVIPAAPEAEGNMEAIQVPTPQNLGVLAGLLKGLPAAVPGILAGRGRVPVRQGKAGREDF